MSHVIYNCTLAELTELDAVAKQLGSTREGVVAAAVAALVAKPPKKLAAPEPEPEQASRRSRKENG